MSHCHQSKCHAGYDSLVATQSTNQTTNHLVEFWAAVCCLVVVAFYDFDMVQNYWHSSCRAHLLDDRCTWFCVCVCVCAFECHSSVPYALHRNSFSQGDSRIISASAISRAVVAVVVLPLFAGDFLRQQLIVAAARAPLCVAVLSLPWFDFTADETYSYCAFAQIKFHLQRALFTFHFCFGPGCSLCERCRVVVRARVRRFVYVCECGPMFMCLSIRL